MSFSFISIAFVVLTIAIPTALILLNVPASLNIAVAIAFGVLRATTDEIVFKPFLTKNVVSELPTPPKGGIVNSLLVFGCSLGLYLLSRPLVIGQAIGAVCCSQLLIDAVADVLLYISSTTPVVAKTLLSDYISLPLLTRVPAG